MYVCIFLVKVTEWPPIGKIIAHSAYEMFSWYKYLIVNLVFSHLGFWSGNLFLIASFPDLNLLVLSNVISFGIDKWTKNMLSITSCSQCSVIYLMISIVKSISLCVQGT